MPFGQHLDCLVSVGDLAALPFRLCLEAPAEGGRLLEGGTIKLLSQRSKGSIHGGKETFLTVISSLSRWLH